MKELTVEEMISFIKMVNWDVVPDSVVVVIFDQLKDMDVE